MISLVYMIMSMNKGTFDSEGLIIPSIIDLFAFGFIMVLCFRILDAMTFIAYAMIRGVL